MTSRPTHKDVLNNYYLMLEIARCIDFFTKFCGGSSTSNLKKHAIRESEMHGVFLV